MSTYKLKDLQVKESRTAYCKVGADLVTYGLGVIRGDIKESGAEPSPEMADAGQRLLTSLQTLSTGAQDEALQSFLFSLFNQKRSGEASKYSFLAYNFLVLYSFTEHGNLQGCNRISQYFSKVIFFARTAILNRITSDAIRDDKGFFEYVFSHSFMYSAGNPGNRIFKQYQSLLLKRSDHPLSPIYSSKNLAKKISQDQERANKVNLVGPKKDIAVLDRITVKMENFGELYQKVLNEVNEMQEDLFGGVSFNDEVWFSFEVPDPLVDLVNFSHPGYCFGDEERNDLKKYEHLGLRVLFHHPRLKDRYGCMVSPEKFVPNAVACYDFLQRASLARSKLATATHISVGGPARGTEFTAQFLRNHPQGDVRHVKIIEGDICLVSGYNKTSSMVSSLFCLPFSLLPTDI